MASSVFYFRSCITMSWTAVIYVCRSQSPPSDCLILCHSVDRIISQCQNWRLSATHAKHDSDCQTVLLFKYIYVLWCITIGCLHTLVRVQDQQWMELTEHCSKWFLGSGAQSTRALFKLNAFQWELHSANN